MARPKKPRKRGKRALARQFRKAQRRRGFVCLSADDDRFSVVGGNGAIYTVPGGGGNVTITGGGSSIAASNVDLVWSNATNATTVNVSSANAGLRIVTATSGTGTASAGLRSFLTPRQIVIESLDEGVTWHTTDTMEPVVRVGDDLVIGTNPSGRAPDCMRAGSGTYRFEIMVRGATDEEARVWAGERADREIHRERLFAEEAEKRKKAEERAKGLLISHLNAAQRRDLEARDGFWVTSQFGHRYWVTRRTAIRFDTRGVALQRYCIHAVDPLVPADDNALARMLLLKCDEERFLRTANPGPPNEWDVVERLESFWGAGAGPGAGGGITIQNTGYVPTFVNRATVTLTGGDGTTEHWLTRPRALPAEPRTALVPYVEPCTAVVVVPRSDELVRDDVVLVEAEVVQEEALYGTPFGVNITEAGNVIPYAFYTPSLGPVLLWVNGIVRPLCG